MIELECERSQQKINCEKLVGTEPSRRVRDQDTLSTMVIGSAILHLAVTVAGSLNAHQSQYYTVIA